MNLYKFRINVIIRIVLIIVLGVSAYFFLIETPFFLVSFWLILFVVILFFNLLRYIEKSYRELTNFLLAIKQNDFSTVYKESDTHFKNLHEAFNIITREFKRLSSEKELNYHFFKTVVEHSGVPLLAYKRNDHTVKLMNDAMKELLGLQHFTRLQYLERYYPALSTMILEMEDGDKSLIKLKIYESDVHISILARKIMLYGEDFMIIALHNIDSELDQKEIESWQKLIRVLTHEIKNSVIPISTLAEVSNQLLSENELEHLNDEDKEDLKISVRTIEKRSKGLVKFVEAYGSLAKTPKPVLQQVDLTDLVKQTIKLQHVECKNRKINLDFKPNQKSIRVMIDREMIEQVLINLIKNAIEAIEKEGNITVSLSQNSQKVKVSVEDDGSGMDDETRENIFIPFFTTKEKGSGIGLSLSRQIIKAHKGTMRVYSEPGKGTRFDIQLPLE